MTIKLHCKPAFGNWQFQYNRLTHTHTRYAPSRTHTPSQPTYHSQALLRLTIGHTSTTQVCSFVGSTSFHCSLRLLPLISSSRCSLSLFTLYCSHYLPSHSHCSVSLLPFTAPPHCFTHTHTQHSTRRDSTFTTAHNPTDTVATAPVHMTALPLTFHFLRRIQISWSCRS
jgi:hypothetical protein